MNEFDLELKAVAGGAAQRKVAAPLADKGKLLIGYTEVPPSDWLKIEKGTHMRYEKTDGKFCRGGFLQNKYNHKTTGKPTFHLESGFNKTAPGYLTFPVTLEDVAKIWVKGTGPSAQSSPASEHKEIENLNRLISLEERLTKMENDIDRLTKFLIRKFSNITEQQQQPAAQGRKLGDTRVQRNL